MSITIIRKSDAGVRQARSRVTLVLAAGAVSGGAFMLGGLIALNRYLKNRKVTDFETYQGISAGALIAAPLAGGLPPSEMLKSLHGTSKRMVGLRQFDFYYPNFHELSHKLAKLIRDGVVFLPAAGRALLHHVARHRRELLRQIQAFAADPSASTLEAVLAPLARAVADETDLPRLATYLPGGVFDNRRMERFVRKTLERNRLPNSFRLLKEGRGRSLYVMATSVDTGEEVVFGPDMRNDVSISEAVQASTALPLFFRPAQIHGEYYLDGAVRRTAGVTFAARRRADLIICYNPFRPFHYSATAQIARNQPSLGDMGIVWILNQAFRSMLHSRLELGMRLLARDPSFNGDAILIEPRETDAEFFAINPVAFWHRAVSAEHGFATTKGYVEEHHDELTALFRRHGMETDIGHLRASGEKLAEARFDDRAILDLLEEPSVPRRLRVR